MRLKIIQIKLRLFNWMSVIRTFLCLHDISILGTYVLYHLSVDNMRHKLGQFRIHVIKWYKNNVYKYVINM